jgi:hypothetical protein
MGQLSVVSCKRRVPAPGGDVFSGAFRRGATARVEMGALGVFWGAWILIGWVRLERRHGVKLPVYENVHFLTKRYRARDSLI